MSSSSVGRSRLPRTPGLKKYSAADSSAGTFVTMDWHSLWDTLLTSSDTRAKGSTVSSAEAASSHCSGKGKGEGVLVWGVVVAMVVSVQAAG